MQKRNTRTCFIFNPAADRNRSTRHIDWLNYEAKKRWEQFEINITRANQSVKELARVKARDFDLVIACGGDGTINQVVSGLVGSRAKLGVLPIGSGNDFVKTLGIDKTLPECMEVLHREYTINTDLIQIEGDVEGWCVNTLGIGLDGLANYYAKNYKKLRGHAVYVAGALCAAFNFRGSKMELILDGKSSNEEYIMVTACNGKWEGGSFFIAPQADMQDGLMDLLTIDKIPVSKVLAYLPRFRWGPSSYMKGVKTRRCKRLEVISEKPVAVHADGEHMGNSIQHLILTVHEQVLQVVTTEDY
jgi:diacylglycerol kinase (ATP)